MVPFANPDKTTGEFIVPPHLEPGTVVLVDKDGGLFSVVSSPPKRNVRESKTRAGVVPFAAAAPVVGGAAAARAMYNPAMGAPPSMEMNRRAGPEVPLYLAIDSLVVEGVQYYEKPAAKDGMHVQYYRNDTEYIDCKGYTLFHCAARLFLIHPFVSILLHFIVGQIIVVLLISIVLLFLSDQKRRRYCCNCCCCKRPAGMQVSTHLNSDLGQVPVVFVSLLFDSF